MLRSDNCVGRGPRGGRDSDAGSSRVGGGQASSLGGRRPGHYAPLPVEGGHGARVGMRVVVRCAQWARARALLAGHGRRPRRRGDRAPVRVRPPARCRGVAGHTGAGARLRQPTLPAHRCRACAGLQPRAQPTRVGCPPAHRRQSAAGPARGPGARPGAARRGTGRWRVVRSGRGGGAATGRAAAAVDVEPAADRCGGRWCAAVAGYTAVVDVVDGIRVSRGLEQCPLWVGAPRDRVGESEAAARACAGLPYLPLLLRWIAPTWSPSRPSSVIV
jgi:hypothetical protein